MACRLEAELCLKCLALDLVFQPEGSSCPRRAECRAAGHAVHPSGRASLSRMCPDLSDLCVHLSKLLVPGHYLHLTLFGPVTKMNKTAGPQPTREIGRGLASEAPQRNGNLWLIKILTSDDLTD